MQSRDIAAGTLLDLVRDGAETLVHLWAPWNAWDFEQAAEIDKLASRLPSLRCVAVNTMTDPRTAQALGVLNLPTLVLFAGGCEAARAVGFQRLEALEGAISTILAGNAAEAPFAVDAPPAGWSTNGVRGPPPALP